MHDTQAHAIAILMNRDHRFLVVQSTDGEWTFPTYTIAEGEDPLQAIVTHADEQLGIDVPMLQCTELDRYAFEDMMAMYVAYICVLDQTPDLDLDAGVTGGWFTIEEIDGLSLGMRQDIQLVSQVAKVVAGLEA